MNSLCRDIYFVWSWTPHSHSEARTYLLGLMFLHLWNEGVFCCSCGLTLQLWNKDIGWHLYYVVAVDIQTSVGFDISSLNS